SEYGALVPLTFRAFRPPPRSTLFPYTRSSDLARTHERAGIDDACIGTPAGAARCVRRTAARRRAYRPRRRRRDDHRRDARSRGRSEEHTSELQSRENLVCRLLLEKKKKKKKKM